MENKTFKICMLSVSIILVLASAVIIINQFKLNKQLETLKNSYSEEPSIKWEEFECDTTIPDYRENLKENITVDANIDVTSDVYNENSVNNIAYVLNSKSKKIHSLNCSSVEKMNEENKLVIGVDEFDYYIQQGYSVCSVCNAED